MIPRIESALSLVVILVCIGVAVAGNGQKQKKIRLTGGQAQPDDTSGAVSLKDGRKTLEYVENEAKRKELEKENARKSPVHNGDKESKLLEEEKDKLKNKQARKEKARKKLIDVLSRKRRSKDSNSTVQGITSLNRKKRAVYDNNDLRWTNKVIPYKFDSDMSELEQQEVRHQMNYWEYISAFRFVPWTQETKTNYSLDHDTYALFVDGSGCWSYVGRAYDTEQKISCCYRGLCRHELAHLIGSLHEQQGLLSEDEIRINWENIDPVHLYSFEIGNHIRSYGGLDISSVMAYDSDDFSGNELDTLTYLDPATRYLVGDGNLYYTAYELHQYYDVATTTCSSFTATCLRGGYPSYVDSTCQCTCPHGLTAASYCDAGESTITNTGLWPTGSYGLPKVTPVTSGDSSCPGSGFSEDGFVQYKGAGSSTLSAMYSASPNTAPESNSIRNEFCVRNDASSGSWEMGSYCIYKGQGNCPSGFEEGSMTLNADDAETSSGGTLPDGTFSGDPVFKFCCRDDAYHGRPISLPTTDPFILFPTREHECQNVKGMKSRMEYYKFKNFADSFSVSGRTPFIELSYDVKYRVGFCYYYHVKQDCGEVKTLTSGEYVIQSPNYQVGNNYNTAEYCSWIVSSPENTQMLLKFESFDLNALTNGDCEDTLEIIHTRPGQRGQRFCGSGMNEEYVTETNFLALHFSSDEANTNKGFKATVEIIDLCYTDQGKSYSGTRSFTRDYEPCLPWYEVTHCLHNLFESTDLDDYLESNYCRNPGNGVRPWCYTDAEQCIRNYCDVCTLESCRDVLDDCEEMTNTAELFCAENAVSCQDTCGQCDCMESVLTYTGNITFTRNGVICQNWDGSSPHSHIYDDPNDFPEATLAEVKNKCRSPDSDTYATWCITSDPNKFWDYCSVPYCSDTAAVAACSDTSSTCQADIDAMWKVCDGNEYMDELRCAKKCGLCPAKPSAPTVGCSAPAAIPSSSYSPQLSSYSLGDTVTFTCDTNALEKKTQVCTSEGTWKPDLKYVCGACPDGWSSRNGDCYKLFDDVLSYSAAKSKCAEYSAVVVTERDSQETTAIEEEIKHRRLGSISIWLGAEVSGSSYVWNDNTAISNNRRKDGYGSGCISDRTSYVGTKSVTQHNITCQRWDNQYPHSHWMIYDSYFPDGSVSSAENYCRDPDNTGWLWCYTMDEYDRYDFCGIPECNSGLDCLSLNAENYWTFEPCTEQMNVMCKKTASAPTICADQANDCADIISKVPDVRTRHYDYALTRCARSAGLCSDSDPSAPNTAVTCDDPGSTGDFTLVSASGTKTVGYYFEYRCNAGYSLTAGNLIRACTLTEGLTGEAPVCTADASVDLWNNNVGLIPRKGALWGLYAYLADNDQMRIGKAGKVKAWRFYSTVAGSLTLQVWRFTQNNGANKDYTLVGQNTVYAQTDRKQRVDITANEQISVLAGDVIGFWMSKWGYAGPSYDGCVTGSFGQFRTSGYKYKTSDFVGSDVTYEPQSDCRVFSLAALIGP